MDMIIADRASAEKIATGPWPTHVISLTDPLERPVSLPAPRAATCLHLSFEDLEDEGPGAPELSDMVEIISFGRNLPNDTRLLVHCGGGICRSTAAAFAILVAGRGDTLGIQQFGLEVIDKAARRLVELRPEALPNMLMVRQADQLLGAGGQMVETAEALSQARTQALLRELEAVE